MNHPATPNTKDRINLLDRTFEKESISPYENSHTQPNVHLSLPKDIAFLNAFGIGYPTLMKAVENAKRHSITAASALIQGGGIGEEDYYRCAAINLGLEFVTHTPDTSQPFIDPLSQDALQKMSRIVPVIGSSLIFHIAPDMNTSDRLKAALRSDPHLHKKLRVCTRSSNLKALENRSRISLARLSVGRLIEKIPNLSAKSVITVKQAIFLLLLLQVLFVAGVAAPDWLALSMHLFAATFYLSCVGLRLFASFSNHYSQSLPQQTIASLQNRSKDGELPIYTVLVALYQESGQVDRLVHSLLALDWPREKLEIKLICEADDDDTLRAVRAAIDNTKCQHIKLVEVPFQAPRTKPKALNYALPLCAGRLLVIYDAEDHPHPLQLREAFHKFVAEPNELVCLQAPLVIHNYYESWLSRMFAIEYSTLFDGLLPVLAKHNLPLPLGGTSNHFKRAALERAQGWDPYNVTEDADLGMRFARMGFTIGTLTLPTLEEAPISISVWLKQRTRWFKGWLQTWLVHMRNPIELANDLGVKGTLFFHVLITGMIISSLVHPILLYFIAANVWKAWNLGAEILLHSPLFWFDFGTVVLGYVAFSLIAYRSLPVRGMRHLLSSIWTLPLYWMLLSVAAWRALLHLFLRPHEWEKTPHRLNFSAAAKNVSTVSGLEPDSWNSDLRHKVSSGV